MVILKMPTNTMSSVASTLHIKHVRHSKLDNQLYIRVDDETYSKILEIQERMPGFKYSTFLRPVIEGMISDFHRLIMENPEGAKNLLRLIYRTRRR